MKRLFFKIPACAASIFLVYSIGISESKTAPPTEKKLPNHAEWKRRLDTLVKPLTSREQPMGLVIGIVTPDSKHVFGYGKISAEHPYSPGSDTIFEIGSITKAFTGILLADLVLEGRVQLDDPVQKHLSMEVKMPTFEEKEITLLHLATHTSTLPSVPLIMLIHGTANPYARFDEKRLFAFLPKLRLRKEPGMEYAYSNMGGGLLGHLLTRKAGAKNYEDLVQQRISRPLGLADTCIVLSKSQSDRLAPPYDSNGKPVSAWDFDALAGAGALRSTTNDMLRFLAANIAAVSPPYERGASGGETQRATKNPPRPPLRKGVSHALALSHRERHKINDHLSIGLAWHISKPGKEGQSYIWHNGGTGGYQSFIAFSKERKFGISVLANTGAEADGTRFIDKIGVEIMEAVLAGR